MFSVTKGRKGKRGRWSQLTAKQDDTVELGMATKETDQTGCRTIRVLLHPAPYVRQHSEERGREVAGRYQHTPTVP